MTHPQRIPEFDLLRVGAILFIVAFWHLRDYHPSFQPLFFYPGLVLIDALLAALLFISGVLIGQRYRFPGNRSPLAFYRDRLLRIYPLYLLALLLMFLLGLNKPGEALQGALLLNMLTATPLRTLWFITLIMLCYLIAPLLLWRYRRGPFLALGGSLCLLLLAAHLQLGWFDQRLVVYLPAFMLGLVVAREPKMLKFWTSPVAAAIGLVIYLFAAASAAPGELTRFAHGHTSTLWWAALVVGLSASASLWWLARTLYPILPQSWLSWLSYVSFAIYLFHRPIYTLLLRCYQPQQPWQIWIYLLGVGLPLTLTIGWGLQKGADRLFARH